MRRVWLTLLAVAGSTLASPHASAQASIKSDCTQAGLARVLERLQSVGRLHNCEVELVFRTSSTGMRQYMLLARDRTPVSGVERPLASYELEIDPACIDASVAAAEPLEQRTYNASYGYADSERDYKVSIRVQTGWASLPRSLVIQEIDLASHRVDRRVACHLDWEGS